MDSKEIIERIESKYPVNKVFAKYRGHEYQIYPWLKGRLFHFLMTGKEVLQGKDASVLSLQLKTLFYGWTNFFRKYNVWIFSKSFNRLEIEGEYHDKILEYIGELFGDQAWFIEFHLFNSRRHSKLKSKYISSKAILLLVEEVYSRFFLRKLTFKNLDILSEIQQELGGSVDVTQICKKYIAQHRVMSLALKILPNPTNVFLTVGYTNYGYIRAFKERGIKVFEFQHGMITKYHQGYYFKSVFDSCQFPDVLAVTGIRNKEVFDEDNLVAIKSVVPVGSYVLSHYYKLKDASVGKKIKVIAVSLQDGENCEELVPFIIKCAEILSGIQFLLKRRSVTEEYYTSKYTFPSNVVFEEKANVYELMAKGDAHCTIYSTAAVESLSLGTTNIIYNYKNFANLHLQQIKENKYSHFVESVDSFCEVVEGLFVPEPIDVVKSNQQNVQANYEESIRVLIKSELNEFS